MIDVGYSLSPSIEDTSPLKTQKTSLDRCPPTHDVGPVNGENYVIAKLFFFLWVWKPNLITENLRFKSVLRDFRWFICHLSTVVKSAGHNKFNYSQVPGSIPA